MNKLMHKTPKVETREPQYAPCFEETPPSLGPMTGWTYRRNPFKLGMTLARYKFIARMLTGFDLVAEMGCADGFGAPLVKSVVNELHLFDFDPAWRLATKETGCSFFTHDIVESGPTPTTYNAMFMLDVLEHIPTSFEPKAMDNICRSLDEEDGVFIAGVPSLESQRYAAEISKAGHVNCRSGDDFRRDMKKYFHNVFLFGMNDEVVHTGFPQMCHYLFALCVGPRV